MEINLEERIRNILDRPLTQADINRMGWNEAAQIRFRDAILEIAREFDKRGDPDGSFRRYETK